MAKKAKSKAKRFSRERNVSQMKGYAQNQGGNFDSFLKRQFKLFKPHDGKNIIRILPPTWDDAEHYAYVIYVNYSIGPDQQTYLSLSKMLNEKDPLDEARREARADGDEKLAKALEPKERRLMWIIDRMAEDEGPQLWPAPWTVDRDIINLCIDEDTGEIVPIDDAEIGSDLRFYKEGKGITTDYSPAKMRILKQSPLSDDEDQMDEWLSFIAENPVPDCLQYYDYDHIAAAFGGKAGRDDDDDDDDEEDEKPRRSKASRKKRDDDEEDEKPRRKSSRKRDEDDDDDDDEKPRKSRSRSKVRDEDDDDDEEDEDPPFDTDDDEAEDEEDDEGDEDEDEEDEDEDEDEEDEKPSKKESVRDRLRSRRKKRN